MLSILSISYSLGYRYIEYISDFKEKIPVLIFSLSTPVGLLIGRYSSLDSANTDILLGISAGTFVMFGINNLLLAGRNTDNVYLETAPKPNNKLFVCLSVFIGLTISGLLQSSVISNIVNTNSTDLLFNVTDSYSTDLLLNVTDSNATDILLNLTK